MSNPYGEDIREQIKNAESSNIILDLRQNYGGNPLFAADYIYPYLFSENIKESNLWYMPDSNANKVVTEKWSDRLKLNFKKADNAPFEGEMLCSKDEGNYKGKAKESKNVIILTSQRTGSAADCFASHMQENGLAKIVGNNTGGEGLMGSYCTSSLPNSKLVFVYMCGGAKNPDGSDNSVVGTKADIYISQSAEDFYEYNSALTGGTDISSYEEMLKYDTVLKGAIEMF